MTEQDAGGAVGSGAEVDAAESGTLRSVPEGAEATGASPIPGADGAEDRGGAEVEATEGASELARARENHTLAQQLEALLIVADEPLSLVALATATDRPLREVKQALAALIADYDGAERAGGAGEAGADAPGGAGSPRGFELREVAGGYRFYVRESLDPIVADFVQQQTPAKLSQAALETLAVVAYRQPISRGAIASIRAVNVDSVVRTLLARGLITEVGQDPETTATLYGTTEALLRHLGIEDISELPPIAPLLDDPAEGFEHESL